MIQCLGVNCSIKSNLVHSWLISRTIIIHQKKFWSPGTFSKCLPIRKGCNFEWTYFPLESAYFHFRFEFTFSFLPPPCQARWCDRWGQSASGQSLLWNFNQQHLWHTIPYCTIPYPLYHTIPYHTILHHTILYHTIHGSLRVDKFFFGS